MGKHDAFSPKALANKMKAKGLQKLRWYCQMCEKQCRDENGFKCHLTSDGHMRMMQVFSENPKSFIDDFSKQFEKGFMDIVRRKWRTKRVFANKVYQEYIAHKEHVHMNGTRWESLSGFVMYLGKTGQCHVDETPKGWYIKYIERDPEVLARQEMIKQKERMDADDEMRNQKLIEKQLEFLNSQGEGAAPTEEVTPVNEFKREDDSQKIQLALNVAKPKKVVAAVNPFEAAAKAPESNTNGVKDEKLESIKSEKNSNDKRSRSRERDRSRSRRSRSKSRSRSRSRDRHHRRDRSRSRDRKSSDRDRRRDRSRDRRSRSRSRSRSRDNRSRDGGNKRKYDDIKDGKDDNSSNKKQKTEHNGTNGSSNSNTNFMDDLIKNQELKREKEGRKPFWLHANIIVKVMNKDLAKGKYFKQKGLVKEVIDKYVALVEMLEDGAKIKIDQQDLETVIPNVGGTVMIVNGAYRGETALLQSLEIDKFKAVVQIDKGPHRGHTLEKEYEDVCKLNV